MNKSVMLFENRFKNNNHTKINVTGDDVKTMTDYVFDLSDSKEFDDIVDIVKESILFDYCELHIKLGSEENRAFSNIMVEFETVTKMKLLSKDKNGIQLLGKFDMESEDYKIFYLRDANMDILTVPMIVILVCSYILLYNPTLEELEEKEYKGQGKKLDKRKDKSKTRKSEINIRRVFKFKEKERPQKISREITCPCWEVRGHYRHYKSGKVVFINPYRKGKGKEDCAPMEHTYKMPQAIAKEVKNELDKN